MPNRRILFVTSGCYLDDSSGAAVATRAMMEVLARSGFSAEALTGVSLETREETAPATWLHRRGLDFDFNGGGCIVSASGLVTNEPHHYRLNVRGVALTLSPGIPDRPFHPTGPVADEFQRLLQMTLDRFQPDVVVNFGGDELAQRVRSLARVAGAVVVFALHNFSYADAWPFTTADAVIVPSRFAADHYRETVDLDCTVLPNLVDFGRILASSSDPRYVTFVNPSSEKGVFAFARIADDLGRKRPDIPFLVVEGRGSERTLANCGLDLRIHGNVSLMSHTPDPRQFWGVTRICVMPSLWWENQPLVAVEAMANGIPVIGSNRGGLPETLGNAGLLLSLPDHLSAAGRTLPTSKDVAPWVEAIIRLWDDGELYSEHRRRAVVESKRWLPEVIEPMYLSFFNEVRPRSVIPYGLTAST